MIDFTLSDEQIALRTAVGGLADAVHIPKVSSGMLHQPRFYIDKPVQRRWQLRNPGKRRASCPNSRGR